MKNNRSSHPTIGTWMSWRVVLLLGIAIMSGDAEAEHVRAWLQHNPCTVLKKPFDLSEIVAWAHNLLDATDRRSGNG